MKHRIFRAYISLARGEFYSASDIGDTVDCVVNGEVIDSLPTTQLNWIENEELTDQICSAWALKQEDFDKKLIILKPSFIQNLVYSSKLRKLFGIGQLRFIDRFDIDGNFILPTARGFLMPEIKNNLIVDLKFYDFGLLKQKAA